jgi:hypothetical protein
VVDELTLGELAANRARLRAAVESLARTYDSIDSTTQALVDATEASAAGGWVPARRPTGFGRRAGVRSAPADPGHGALLSLADVASRTGRHPELLRRWCAEGRLPAVLLARAWFIRSSDLPAVAAMPLRSPRSR